jgi:hypothetical protein
MMPLGRIAGATPAPRMPAIPVRNARLFIYPSARSSVPYSPLDPSN